jgi:hypothetical protein
MVQQGTEARMNIFKALAVKDIETATKAIPLIDVGERCAESRARWTPWRSRFAAPARWSASSTWPVTVCRRP